MKPKPHVSQGKAQQDAADQIKKVRTEAKEAADEIRRKQTEKTQKVSPLFTATLSAEKIPAVCVLSNGGNIDWSKPWLQSNPDSLKLCLADAQAQKALAAWGAQFTKVCSAQGLPIVTHPMEKQAKENFHKFVMGQVPEGDQLDLKPVAGGEAFQSAAWLFGCSSNMKHLAALPNHACLFKVIACGQIRTLLVEVDSLRAGIAEIQQKPELLGLSEALNYLRDADEAALGSLCDHKVVMRQVAQSKNDLLFVPAGWLMMEVAASSGDLIFGLRKSVFMRRFSKEYETAIALQGSTGTDRMKQILEIKKSAGTQGSS